jgi:hypothetical protein
MLLSRSTGAYGKRKNRGGDFWNPFFREIGASERIFQKLSNKEKVVIVVGSEGAMGSGIGGNLYRVSLFHFLL